MEDFTCPRCNGKGGIDYYAHVVRGVCFECWGTKDSFQLRRLYLLRRLDWLRAEYRRVQRSGVQGDLPELVERGNRVKGRLQTLELELAAARERYQPRAW